MNKEQKPQIFSACDIDQTLTDKLVPTHAEAYNRLLDLGMSIESVEKTEKYGKTFDVPEIINWRAGGAEAEQKFQEARTYIRSSKDVHLNFPAVSEASEGIKTLIRHTEFKGYFTVRPPEIETATKEWLENHNFPNKEKVIICSNPEDKLLKLIPYCTDTKQVVLIDDGAKELVSAAKLLAEKQPELKTDFKNLIIVGFRIKKEDAKKLEGEIYPGLGLRVLTLPSWQKPEVENLIIALI